MTLEEYNRSVTETERGYIHHKVLELSEDKREQKIKAIISKAKERSPMISPEDREKVKQDINNLRGICAIEDLYPDKLESEIEQLRIEGKLTMKEDIVLTECRFLTS